MNPVETYTLITAFLYTEAESVWWDLVDALRSVCKSHWRRCLPRCVVTKGIRPHCHHVNPPMPTIERLRVDPIELAHGLGEIGLGRLHQQMEVVVHQTYAWSRR